MLDELAAECRAQGGQALAVPTDVSKQEEVANLAQTTLATFGRIDVWINNAGSGSIGLFEEVPLNEHVQVIETDLLGTLFGSYSAMRQFKQQGQGILINVASVIGKIPAPYFASYAAAKHGVVGLSAALRQELELHKMENIRVCTVMPTSMDTPFFEHAADHTGHKVVPIPPVFEPEQVIDALVSLATDPKDEVTVGGASGPGFVLMHNLFPGLTEHMMAQITDKSLKKADPAPDTPWQRRKTDSIRHDRSGRLETVTANDDGVNPVDMVALTNQGRDALQAERFDEAAARFADVTRIAPRNAQAFFYLGEAFSGLDRPPDAIKAYREAVRLEPGNAAYQSALGAEILRYGRVEEASRVLARAAQMAPDHADTWKRLGYAYAELEKHDEAISAYRQALRFDPDDLDAQRDLAFVLDERGQSEEAIAIYERLCLTIPNDARLWYNRGVALDNLEREEEAIAAYREAVRLDPDNARAHFNLGNQLHLRGQTKEAFDAFRAAVHARPDYGRAYFRLGDILDEWQEWEDAVEAYKAAAAYGYDPPHAYNNLGTALKDLGRDEEAVAAYQEALRRDPALPDTWFNLGLAYTDLERYGEAIEAYGHALQLNPNEPLFYDNLGIALDKAERYAEAIAAYEDALDLNPYLASAHHNLAISLLSVDQEEEALEAFRVAARLTARQCPLSAASGRTARRHGERRGRIEILWHACPSRPERCRPTNRSRRTPRPYGTL